MPANLQVLIELFVQPLISWHLESSPIAYQFDDVARAIQDRAAMSTILKVGRHSDAETGIQLVVKIVGNLAPYRYTVDFDRLLRQAVAPFTKVRSVFKLATPGASGKDLRSFDTATSKR